MNRKETEKKRIMSRLKAGKSVSLNREQADKLAEKLLKEDDLKRIIKKVIPSAEFLSPDEALESIERAEKELRQEPCPLDEMDVIEHTELILDGTVTARDVAQMELRFKHTFGIGARGNNTQEM